MCGIVGAVAERNVIPILVEGLRRLEYRGYDSAGVAIINRDGQLSRTRSVGKVASLSSQLDLVNNDGGIGIAHTRWATHGAPSEANAHPHVAGNTVAVVHNGIIENYERKFAIEQRDASVTSSVTPTPIPRSSPPVILSLSRAGQPRPRSMRCASTTRGARRAPTPSAWCNRPRSGSRGGRPAWAPHCWSSGLASVSIFLPPTWPHWFRSPSSFLILEDGDIAELQARSA